MIKILETLYCLKSQEIRCAEPRPEDLIWQPAGGAGGRSRAATAAETGGLVRCIRFTLEGFHKRKESL